MSSDHSRSGGDGGAGSPTGEPALLTPRSGRVKEARKLSRRAVREQRGLFLVEGAKSIAEALTVPGCVREVYAAPAASAEPASADVLAACDAAGVPVRACDDAAIAALADTVTPQGLVAACGLVAAAVSADELAARTDGARLVVVCADVRDPGNAGTVIRCGDAAGADLVVLAGSSVDPHNPKTVRATVGSLFHLPVLVHAEGPDVTIASLQAAGLQVLAADGAGTTDLDDAADDGTLAAPTAWLFGNEAWGLPPGLVAASDAGVAIPIHGRAESLNLATAAAVCLYASARAQRRRTVQS